VDGVSKFVNSVEKVEQGLNVVRRSGVKELMAEEQRAEALEEMRAQRSVDRAKATLQGIADITSLFSGKSEKAQKRAFDINKKASMGTAIIDGIVATQKAFKSAPPPLSFILAAAAAASALVRVKAISNQQFESSSANSGGGGGGGGGSSVGDVAMPAPTATNPNSQLLNPPANNQGSGMRAYVVESDIRSVSGRLRRMSEFATLGA